MRRAFAVAILLLTACGSASDEDVDTTARGVPAKSGVPAGQDFWESHGWVWVWVGSGTAPHSADADLATCTEEANENLKVFGDCMNAKGWQLKKR